MRKKERKKSGSFFLTQYTIIDMTIPLQNKESMACLQTSKTKFMITDILSGSEGNNNSNGTSDHSATNHGGGEMNHPPPVHPHLPHHLMLQRDAFSHHHQQMMQAAAAATNGRMSSPEYDDGASDCDSDEMNDDNSVCSNGECNIGATLLQFTFKKKI